MSGSKTGEYWIIAVPNSLPVADPSAKSFTWKILDTQLDIAADVFPFDIPELRTGTLDRLMKAADILQKLDGTCEQVVRKVERQFNDLLTPETADLVLEVEEMPVLQYVENYQWNTARYPVSRSLNELMTSIHSHAARLEEELKESSLYLSDKRSTVTQLLRKTQGNLSVVDLRTIITEDVIIEYNLIESAYLIDVVFLVPRSNEKQFIQDYEKLADEAVDYEENTGSPVVPRSAAKISQDKEYALYSAKVLKRFLKELKRDALSKRYVVKDIDFSVIHPKNSNDPTNSDKDTTGKDQEVPEYSEELLKKAEKELKIAVTQMRLWCQAHYGEAFSAWLHVKALRVFVEAALRYGLPVNFGAVLVGLRKGASSRSKARKILFEKYKNLDENGMMATTKDETSLDELFPYISYDLSVFGTKS